MLSIVQPIFKFILTSGATLCIAFMIIRTAFIGIYFIRGDIRISMVKDNETEKENK